MLIEELRRKYIDSGEVERLLKGTKISVLKEFLDNWEVIVDFYKSYYAKCYPKIVLCGINPGKNGAGKTGIPFLDFASLSKISSKVTRSDTERSAQFFYDVVSNIGADTFYKNFYVTNVSWVGYIKNNKNLNYYDLPDEAKRFVLNSFTYEMQCVEPTTIISLSGEVHNTVKSLFSLSDIDVSHSLPHPNYCAFPKNYEMCIAKYIDLLSEYTTA